MPDIPGASTVGPRAAQVGTICQVLITLGLGGAEVLAARLARQLSARYRFIFVCLDEVNILGEQLTDEGFVVRHVGRRPGLDWGCAARIAAVLREQRVDVVHAHQYTPFFYAALARLRYRHPRILFTEHGRDYPDVRRMKRVLANRLLLERRDRVVAVGHAVKQALIEKEGLPPARVEVVYNGVELSPYLERRGDRLAVREEIGVDPDAFVIIQVARLNHLKDHGTALRALTRIVRQRDDVRLVLVGIGEAQAEVQQLVIELGLQRYVRFLGRRLDAARLLQAADLFLLTSITEGIPLTLIEAMASGLPIVATDVGGVKEVVSEGETALLAPPRDDKRLADHVLVLAADSARRRQFGERGRVRAQARFTEQQMHEGYGRIYDDLLRE